MKQVSGTNRQFLIGSYARVLNPSSPHYSVRREKALCVSQVQVLSGELSGHPSRDQDGQKGHGLVEALGTEAHRGWVSEPTGRNTREA
jgi:hypothetical protein